MKGKVRDVPADCPLAKNSQVLDHRRLLRRLACKNHSQYVMVEEVDAVLPERRSE